MIRIESMAQARKLKAGDILYLKTGHELQQFRITQIDARMVVVISDGNKKNLKAFPFDELLSDKWFVKQ